MNHHPASWRKPASKLMLTSTVLLFSVGKTTVNGQQQQPAPEIFYLLQTIPTLTPTFGKYETPMASRFANYYDSTWWNCVAAYSADYNDSFTKIRPAVVSSDSSAYTTANRAKCVVQATASLNAFFFGGIPEYLRTMEEKFPELSIQSEVPDDVRSCIVVVTEAEENDTKNLFSSSGRMTETDIGNTTFRADDICLRSVAAQSNHDPTIMGHVIALQTYAYAVNDGYNMLGQDGGCTVNCRPYADTTGYTPKGTLGRWRPLMEENERGFYYKQEFVTPHIGQKAKFRFLPESDRVNRLVRKPSYSVNRESEIQEVINQMGQLDDYKK
eukprot:scaffold138738_cov23-Cyclotella_meneghiniana.AAC.1